MLDALTPPDRNGNPLLGSDDPPVFEVFNFDAARPVLIACDHAHNTIPAIMDNLGLAPDALRRHIAYDIGAVDVTKRMATHLGAPAVLSGFSRLVIDCNRQPGDPQSIPRMSDGAFVPGNRDLSEDDQVRRVETFHEPYHHALSQMLAHIWRSGTAPWLFSLHSFTPTMNGEDRLWDIGVMWSRDSRIAKAMIEILRAEGLRVGDNEPYSGRESGYTMDRHAGAAGLPHVAGEIRQDHLETAEGAAKWAGLLSEVFKKLLVIDDLHGVKHC